jgi:ryanodine receptor 2
MYILSKFDFSRIPPEDDDDYIDIGGAILSFYASLVELLGRCAPSEETIKMGKSDSIRARSILRSLVSMEDLEGVLALRFILPIPHQQNINERLPGLQPNHKMSIVLFLERVYGIPDQSTFFRLLENGFLPDIRCATILDSVLNCLIYIMLVIKFHFKLKFFFIFIMQSSCAECDMALALNRYICCSVLPLLTSYSHYFDASEKKTSLMDSVLNTVYRLSKCKSLTTGQLEVVCKFLISFTKYAKYQFSYESIV